MNALKFLLYNIPPEYRQILIKMPEPCVGKGAPEAALSMRIFAQTMKNVSGIVGSAMGDGVAHRFDDMWLNWTFIETDYSGYTAHGT